MLLHYLGKLKNANFLQIYGRYGRKCKQITFWLHWWIPVSCSLSSWLKTKSLTVFSSDRALCGLPLPGRLSTVPVSRNFFSCLLTPHFVRLFSGNSSVNLFAVYPVKYNFYQNLVLVAEYHVDCWQTVWWCLLWRISGATNWSQK